MPIELAVVRHIGDRFAPAPPFDEGVVLRQHVGGDDVGSVRKELCAAPAGHMTEQKLRVEACAG